MAFNNIAVCILINLTLLVYFHFSATKLTFFAKKIQTKYGPFDTFTQEKKICKQGFSIKFCVAQE